LPTEQQQCCGEEEYGSQLYLSCPKVLHFTTLKSLCNCNLHQAHQALDAEAFPADVLEVMNPYKALT
jgi:hypothetical protein